MRRMHSVTSADLDPGFEPSRLACAAVSGMSSVLCPLSFCFLSFCPTGDALVHVPDPRVPTCDRPTPHGAVYSLVLTVATSSLMRSSSQRRSASSVPHFVVLGTYSVFPIPRTRESVLTAFQSTALGQTTSQPSARSFVSIPATVRPEPLLFPIFLCSRPAQCRRRVCAHTECNGRQRTSCPFIVRRSLQLLLLLGACSSLFHSARSLRVAPQRPNGFRVVSRASPHILRILPTFPAATRAHICPQKVGA